VTESFDKSYYTNNGQVDDRPALGWYKRLARKYLDSSHILDFGCGTGTLISRLAPKHLGSQWDVFFDNTHCNLMTAIDIRRLLTRHGFIPIKEFTDGPWNGPYLTKSKIAKMLLRIPRALQVFTGIKLRPVGFGESHVGNWRLRLTTN